MRAADAQMAWKIGAAFAVLFVVVTSLGVCNAREQQAMVAAEAQRSAVAEANAAVDRALRKAEEDARLKAMEPKPPMEEPTPAVLKLGGRGELAELRRQVAAGRVKLRSSPTCMGDMVARHHVIQGFRSSITGTMGWATWGDPVRDPAELLDDAALDAIRCVNCVEKDVASCASFEGKARKAEAALAKL